MEPGLDILALQKLIGDDENDEDHVYGSALTPGSLHGKPEKDIAKPNAKVEVKTFNRATGGGATQESIEEQKKQQKLQDPKNQIWSAQEVAEKAETVIDDRATPDFEIMHMQ